jgi:NADH-quinone oxidoreductase subunit E
MASSPVAVDRARKFEKVCSILERYGHRPSGLIPILQAVQHEYQYLPEEVLTYVAMSLDIPPARVFGVATFYAHFALEPKGKHVIRVCDGTACHVKHSLPVLDALHQKLGTDEKRKTTADMLFTVETVACLGACGLAPVLVIDEQVYGGITPERAVALVDEITVLETAPPCAPMAPAVRSVAEEVHA